MSLNQKSQIFLLRAKLLDLQIFFLAINSSYAVVGFEALKNISYTVNRQKFTVKKSSRIAKTANIKRTKVFNRIHCNT